MEATKTNLFEEMSMDEMQQIDGGAIPVAVVGGWILKGVVVGASSWATQKVLDHVFG